MSVKRKLTLRFSFQLGIAGIIVLIMAAACFLWMLQRMSDIQMSHSFASIGLERLVESTKLEKDGFHFDSILLEQVKENEGWLQSLDENGKVHFSYNTPPDVPKNYAPGELVGYWNGTAPFPYDLYLWIQEKEGKLFTLIYGAKSELRPLIEEVSGSAAAFANGQLMLPEGAANRIARLGGYVQLLDADGAELASYNSPNGIPKRFTNQELALRTLYSERYEYRLISSYDDATQQTWIVGLPHNEAARTGNGGMLPAEIQVLAVGVAAMFAAMLAIFLLLSLWNAHRFGSPMLHILAWLDKLGNGSYEEPTNRRGIQRSRSGKGKWKRRYRIFADVLDSLDKLAKTLKRDAAMRNQTNKLREEWIAGITHDLKTPLSSIKGYAHMLTEPKYEWSAEEIRKFSGHMLDKSAHMDSLVNDLALAYRLKSGIAPPESEAIELNEWMDTMLSHLAQDAAYSKSSVIFQPAGRSIVINLYTPWLERAVNNLVANSLLHNPPGTVLTVTVELDGSRNRLALAFADNGNGMDEHTLNTLFDRYYRGTNTSAPPNGSGLGMAITKELVEAMGGEIMVETAVGEGTTIRLVFDTA